MLSLSKIDVVETLKKFKSKDLNPAFLVPTKTGLEKSIMDATRSFREFLLYNNIHDFDQQSQGKDNKKIIPATLISSNNVTLTKVSLYRPETKKGDPRVWVHGLKKDTFKNDLLAFLENDGSVIIINCSNNNLSSLLNNENPLFIKYIKKRKLQKFSAAEELLHKIVDIYKKGFVKTKKAGDTGIGFTLETLLGIEANSSGKPDYKGIEVKSSRSLKNRPTLFSKVPNWSRSKLKKDEIAIKRGRKDPNKGNLSTLFHTIKSTSNNSYNLSLSVEENDLFMVYDSGGLIEKDLVWDLHVLKQKLYEKHKETFWVEAVSRGTKNSLQEEFLYKKILHTGGPDFNSFITLLETGEITIDLLLWEKRSDWRKYINKQGEDYLFKIAPKCKELLFSEYKTYNLCEF